jgi:uncharacterized protein (DUF1697 family)
MGTYVILLRGINVGGNNKVPMASLKACLEKLGLEDVSTYIASGNVLARSTKTAAQVKTAVEAALRKNFTLSDGAGTVHVLTHAQLKAVVKDRPDSFGDHPEKYHSDAIFLMGVPVAKAMKAFSPREGVDAIWPGTGMIYSQRLSAERTKSRLNTIMSSPLYKQMTIRNWNTTTKLLALLEAREKESKK